LVVYDERERPRFLRRADAAAAWALDVGIAFVTLIPTIGVLGHGTRPGDHGAVAEVVTGAVLSVAPLVVRRRWPVQVLAFILLVAVVVPGPAVFWPPALVALYTIASRRPWRVAVASTLATAIVFALHRVVWGYSLPLFGVIAGLALALLALVLGLYQATRLAYLEQPHQRADRLERERKLLDEQAAAEERLRIARELHDVVAHNVSLMVVQAQALGTGAEAGERVREGAQAIAELGRGAMGEMHRTLELMRPEDGDGERSPQPTLAGLGALIEQARTAGVSVELSVGGSPRALDAGIELSAYRIVQEALTNVIKHAGAAHASVNLRYGEDQLALEVLDDGGATGDAADRHAPRSGHGLVGMRERVALFGGTLHAGPDDGRGYRVQALLPYGARR
jgi:signal transduction histidine kinase